MSLRASAGRPRNCSGAMYASVPATTPASVSDCRDLVVPSAGSSLARRFARPKSSAFTSPSGVTTTFALLKSRCTTPFACACASAAAICWPYATTSAIGSAPRATRSLSDWPSTSSIAT